MDLDTTVFACGDADVVAGYEAHAALERALLNGCVEEAKERWRRLPVIAGGTTRNVVVGLALREHDWTWEAWYAAQKVAEPDRGYHGVPKADDPPPGWRKRVKDEYFSPPLAKGGSKYFGSREQAKEARDFCRKWSHESLRGYLERVHGAQHIHFAGLRLITIGADVREDKVWIVSGKGYTVKDERFQPVPLSEYVAMRERNPEPETEDEDD